MSRGARASLLGLAILLLLIGMLQPDPGREMSPTTFGTAGYGYRAVFELFETLGLPVERSYEPADALPTDATIWWIEPEGVCRSNRASREDEAGLEAWRGEEWIAAGGTAVVFLPAWDGKEPHCETVAGFVLPARRGSVNDGTSRDVRLMTQEVKGRLVAQPRRLEMPELSVFLEAGEGDVLAELGDLPFMLEFGAGEGRLVVVADSRFLRNRWLDRGDAAPLALDVARAFGVPRFDERSHGLHRERHPLRFLLRSSAAMPLAGATLLALLFLWSGRALPPRRMPESPGAAPMLEEFVASLARLYSTTGDHGPVLERYRQLTAARLRRYFGLPAEIPPSVLVERLTRSGRVDPAALRSLTATAAPADAGELRAAVRALDAVVNEATR